MNLTRIHDEEILMGLKLRNEFSSKWRETRIDWSCEVNFLNDP
jgi:hypothetical protein